MGGGDGGDQAAVVAAAASVLELGCHRQSGCPRSHSPSNGRPAARRGRAQGGRAARQSRARGLQRASPHSASNAYLLHAARRPARPRLRPVTARSCRFIVRPLECEIDVCRGPIGVLEWCEAWGGRPPIALAPAWNEASRPSPCALFRCSGAPCTLRGRAQAPHSRSTSAQRAERTPLGRPSVASAARACASDRPNLPERLGVPAAPAATPRAAAAGKQRRQRAPAGNCLAATGAGAGQECGMSSGAGKHAPGLCRRRPPPAAAAARPRAPQAAPRSGGPAPRR